MAVEAPVVPEAILPDSIVQTRDRSFSHKEYLATLRTPSEEEIRRISEIQLLKETVIDRKYHTLEEHDAATTIQKAYRGHRDRRALNGQVLDPSARWVDLIREYRFRAAATATYYRPLSPRLTADGRVRSASDIAKLNWQRAGYIAEHAVDSNYPSPSSERESFMSVTSDSFSTKSQEKAKSLLLDMRYFLEMVDQKHRYGANLLVYHEEWLRSSTDQNFFHWLDRGDGRFLSLPGCSREKLDKERIRYLSRDERRNYLVRVDDEGKLRWEKNNELITTSINDFRDSMSGIVPKNDDRTPSFNDDIVARKMSESRKLIRRMVRTRSDSNRSMSDISQDSSSEDSSDDMGRSYLLEPTSKPKKARKKSRHLVSPATILNRLLRATVKPGTWIYVSDTVGRLYVGIKTSGAFQHASFLSGARISSAGSIGVENGPLTYLSPLSGHYRPTTRSFTGFIRCLKEQDVDLSRLKVSKAFEVLLGMEAYGKTKKGMKDIVHHRSRSAEERPRSMPPSSVSLLSVAPPATSEVEENWKRHYQKGVAKLMQDMHIQNEHGRRSGEVQS